MEYAFRSKLTRAVLALVVLASFTGLVWAQGGTGELDGLVTDPSGAVVSGAPLVLVNIATGDKRVAETSSSGSYRFVALPVVGSYQLEITAKGFKGYKLADIIVSVGTVVTRDIRLEVGTTGEQVTVEAGAQAVQTTESSLSGLVDRHVWQDMPLETRSQNEFIALLPGAEPAAQAGLTTDRGAAVNGTRSGTGNFLVEGFDNNDQGLGGGGSSVGPGGANTTISPDAIQEYRVIEHIPPAEYGKAGGFVTDTVLKGGTNQWHGSLFEYNRVQALAANSWFSNHNDVKDSLVRNQFGGSFGGPIVKDKTFFYFTVEDHRERTASPLTANSMTPDFLNFVNSGAFETFQESDPNGLCVAKVGAPCPGAFAASSTLGPIFSSASSAEHLPLCVTGASNCHHSAIDNIGQGVGYTTGLVYPVDVYGQVTVAQPSSINQIRYTAKLDQKFGSKDQLNGAYLYDNADFKTAFAGGDNSFGPTLFDHVRAQNLGITWSHTFSPTILNQARVSYTRHTANFPGDPAVAGVPSVFTFFDENSAGLGNSSGLPQFFTENEFTYKDDISITKGKHNLKFGASYTRTRNGSSFESFKNGLFTPYSVEDLVTDGKFGDEADNAYFGGPAYGSFYYAEASINPATNQLPVYYRGFRANEFAFYGQDDWRVNSRLTLNLGLRWEYFGPPHNFQSGVDADYYTGSNATPFLPTNPGTGLPSTNPFFPSTNPFYAAIGNGSAQIKNSDIWNKDTNNFGPRLGFAYDVMGNQKFVVRGGYGISYDRMFNNIFENIRFNPPLFAISAIGFAGNGVTIGGLSTPGVYTSPFTSTAAFGGSALTASLRDVDQNLVTAYYEQANFGFEYALPSHMVLETNYVGTFGHKLLGIIGANTFDGRTAGGDSTKVNPTYSNISLRGNCCDSNYSALQTSLRKQFSSGLQFNVNYTYSKAMDDISDTFTTKNASAAAYPTDSENPRFDYGPADFNVKHRAVGSVNYDLPFAKGNRWLGGWGISGIVTVQSGAAFSVIDSCNACDSNADGQFNDRASWLGSGPVTNAINHNVSPANGYLTNVGWGQPRQVGGGGNLIDLPCPASINGGAWCEGAGVFQTRRNSLVGPGYFNTDLGVSKAFKISESSKVTLYGNFFNIFNHPNFGIPDANLNNGTFGQSTGTFAPRVTQLALRFDF
jgi:Carboxypeptidase regulatory-like domain/TonB dependent receptor